MPPLQTPSFPTLLALLILLALSLTLTTSTTTEIQALVAIKSSLIDPRATLDNWTTTSPSAPCDWLGVACLNDRVYELSLNRLSLSGVISDRVGELKMLRRLSLHSNDLHGVVPATIVKCSLLRAVYLHRNRFVGQIPVGVFHELRNLQVFMVAENLFSGVLPPEITSMARLTVLDLSMNKIGGPLPVLLPPSLVVANFSYNRFSSNIPASIGHLQELKVLHLSFNDLTGTLPAAVVNCSSLRELRVESNALEGQIPSTIGQLANLEMLSVSDNNFSGAVPSGILFNASKLKVAQFGFNEFTDISSPGDKYSKFPGVLEVLELQGNRIRGVFPKWITGVFMLRILDISRNMLDGALPVEIGKLVKLVELRVAENKLSRVIPSEIRKCSSLQVLDIGYNGFSGQLPEFLAELTRLRVLDLGGNQFSGSIPVQFWSLSSLQVLDIGDNMLTGNVPNELMQLGNLSILNLSYNKLSVVGGLRMIGNLRNLKELNLCGIGLSGMVPSSIGNLMQLVTLDLSKQNISGSLPIELFGLPGLKVVALEENQFSGNVPESFSSLQSLEHLNLSLNRFTGEIPSTFGFLANLVSLSMSRNSVSGVIPAELGNCSALEFLQLHSNNLTGKIPSVIGSLSRLKELDLSLNNLTGEIPDSVSGLSNLSSLDLSFNSLTGQIPVNLNSIPSLIYLNVSHNNLEGQIPKPLGYRFKDPSAFSCNTRLCGKPLKKECEYVVRRKRRKLITILSVAAAAAFLLALCCSAYVFSLLRWRSRLRAGVTGEKKRSPRSSGTERGSRGSRGNGNGNGNGAKLVMFSTKITYAEALEATRNFDEENILSRGKYGLVFKALFPDGMVLAIRRLADGSITESMFKREAEALGKVKHRNLTVLRGYYAGPPDTRLLVHDYMPNGNLSTLLQEASHHDGHVLNWPMRHLIALGIARGLAFLHSLPIIHGDIKPQIILFDADFEAHISDFGLSRLTLATPADPSSSSTLVGTLGYISPEAALTGQATLESDVYSFGIVLLEILTGKKPVMFTQDEDIVKWVKRTLQRGQVSELLEPGLLELDPETSEWEEFLLGIKVGLLCTAPDPPERPSMSDIVFMLEGCRVGPDISSSADPTSLPSPT